MSVQPLQRGSQLPRCFVNRHRFFSTIVKGAYLHRKGAGSHMRNMNRVIGVFITVFFIVIGSQDSHAGAGSKLTTGTNGIKYVSNQILVKTSVPATKTELTALAKRAGMKTVKAFPENGHPAHRFADRRSPSKLAVELTKRAIDRTSAEPDYAYDARWPDQTIIRNLARRGSAQPRRGALFRRCGHRCAGGVERGPRPRGFHHCCSRHGHRL